MSGITLTSKKKTCVGGICYYFLQTKKKSYY